MKNVRLISKLRQPVWTIFTWSTGRLIVRNHWSMAFNGFPILMIQFDRSSTAVWFDLAFLGFKLVIFIDDLGSKTSDMDFLDSVDDAVLRCVPWVLGGFVIPMFLLMCLYIWAAFACTQANNVVACYIMQW